MKQQPCADPSPWTGARIGSIRSRLTYPPALVHARESDIFRSTYRALTEAEQAFVGHVKSRAARMADSFDQYQAVAEGHGSACDPRCLALARTKLEEAVMWATKAASG